MLPKSQLSKCCVGGPGSGKGTRCSKIAHHFGFTHLSVGELLDAQVKSGSSHGKMIEEYKEREELVSSDIVARALQQTMHNSNNSKFLIDGFPRDQDNLAATEKIANGERSIEEVFESIKAIVFSELLVSSVHQTAAILGVGVPVKFYVLTTH